MMKTMFRIAAFALVPLATLPCAALAAAPTPAPVRPAEPAPEAVALGRTIVATAFPPESREAVMDKLMATMLNQMKAGMPLETVSDAGVKQILLDYLAGIPKVLRPATTAFLPKQLDAIARAYARMFSLTELKDIAAFAGTASGRSFLQRSTEVMSDPDVAVVNEEYFRQVQELNARSTPELTRKIDAYLKAHPNAASGTPATSANNK
jgi:hypothetical protein